MEPVIRQQLCAGPFARAGTHRTSSRAPAVNTALRGAVRRAQAPAALGMEKEWVGLWKISRSVFV
jgi:hypothetical protein